MAPTWCDSRLTTPDTARPLLTLAPSLAPRRSLAPLSSRHSREESPRLPGMQSGLPSLTNAASSGQRQSAFPTDREAEVLVELDIRGPVAGRLDKICLQL